jgi:hypothetical protein
MRPLHWTRIILLGIVLLSLAENALPQVVHQTGQLVAETVTRVSGTPGELEVVSSDEGHAIVVAVNNILGNAPFAGETVFFSVDGGVTFAGSSLASQLRNRRDPTVGRAGSGRFFYAGLQGSNIALGVSKDNGRSFEFVSNTGAMCAKDPKAISCGTDQPHIAADPRASASGDQIYVVWRQLETFPKPGGGTTERETQMIQCSTDGGATWQPPLAIGLGMLARVTTGPDGRVYAVFVDRRTGPGRIFLQRFSPCAAGFTPAFTHALPVARFDNVACPVPGLDRCNDGNILSSPTVAVDRSSADIVFVTWANRAAFGNEDIMTIGSFDGGANFRLGPVRVSSHAPSRKFMPWSCGADGEIFIGWYDRRAATIQANDNTQYFVRSLQTVRTGVPIQDLARRFSSELDVTGGVVDRQCASGWPHAPRSSGDAESCSQQPRLAGVCAPMPAGDACKPANGRPAGCGCDFQTRCAAGTTCAAGRCIANHRLQADAAPRCQFSRRSCASGETCHTGRGAPKYGDYNGIACGSRTAFTAWASGTPPRGAAGGMGFGVFGVRVTPGH